jgi:hypothetical protein
MKRPAVNTACIDVLDQARLAGAGSIEHTAKLFSAPSSTNDLLCSLCASPPVLISLTGSGSAGDSLSATQHANRSLPKSLAGRWVGQAGNHSMAGNERK